jgi:uridylate kinase
MGNYRRILLKLSGESLMGKQQSGIDPVRLYEYADEIAEVIRMGVQVAIVTGGGNIFRGLSGTGKGIDRVRGDQMGMLATVINSLALQSALISSGSKARVFTSVRMEPVGEYYSKQKAIEALEEGVVAIIAGGTGNPYFTTDTAAALRGIETEADVMLKGTRVNGVYSADPEKVPGATLFETISFDEIYRLGLRIMDLTATTLCRENHLPVVVFNMDTKGNLLKLVQGLKIGTFVTGG